MPNDGTIEEEAEWILSELAKWFAVNSEAVYDTRPWRISREGHSIQVCDCLQSVSELVIVSCIRFIKRKRAVGIKLDIERSQLSDVSPVPWMSETCIGEWFYKKTMKYKTPHHILDILIDTIAKNGTMLLNIVQRPDGTIDEEAEWILSELAKWFAVNSEAV